LQQLFLNLVTNAIDASPPGRVIWIFTGEAPRLPAEGRAGILRGKADAPSLAVHILDAGSGLSPEQLPRIFEPFFSSKGSSKGTGLGLAIVEEIMRAHRAEIEILSIPEQGTEVIVRLPLATDATALSLQPAPEGTPHA